MTLTIRTRNIQPHLHHVGPDNGGHSAFERVNQGQGADDGDRYHVSRANRDAHHNRHGEDTDSFRCRAQEKKQKCCELMQVGTKALTNDLVGRQQFATKIAGQKNDAHHDPAQEVAENDFQKAPVSGVGESGHADDGQRTGFRGHDGEGNGPPGDPAIGEKVVG